MSGLFDDDLKRRVREANNLVDLVQASVGKLVRSGSRLKACCPFHNEKTPSFYVNPELQVFKCFGCGKSGDVFTFVMLHDRVEFPEALKMLAERAGIRVEYDQRSAEQYAKEKDWKSYLYKLNDAAARFFREQLFAEGGQAARAYLKKRGLSDACCEQFALGYAPAGGSPLIARLRSQRAPDKAIVLAGLASEREGSNQIRDFFFDRLMFPIHDAQGRTIAFGGRILGDGEPKYINTRETPLFSKTKTVYALDLARDEIVKTRQAILVEGYTDVMMCHQFGVTNVVACLGTAVTAEHIKSLRRVADNLLMLTDSDAAGAKASERSLGVLFQEQMPARVARLPGGTGGLSTSGTPDNNGTGGQATSGTPKLKDPCEFLLARGKEPFLAELAKSQDLFDYKFECMCALNDISTPHGQKAAAEELMATISLIPDTLLKNRYRYEVQKRLSIDERDLKYTERDKRDVRDTKDEPTDDTGTVPPPESELARGEREILRYLFHYPAALERALTQLDLAALSGKPEGLIGRALLAAYAEGAWHGHLAHDVHGQDARATTGDSGSTVAREVLNRLQAQTEDGRIGQAGAVPLCIELAEVPPTGSKLDSESKLDILIRPVLLAGLNLRHDAASRRLAFARQKGDSGAADKAYQELVEVRRQLAKVKTRGGRELGTNLDG